MAKQIIPVFSAKMATDHINNIKKMFDERNLAQQMQSAKVALYRQEKEKERLLKEKEQVKLQEKKQEKLKAQQESQKEEQLFKAAM